MVDDNIRVQEGSGGRLIAHSGIIHNLGAALRFPALPQILIVGCFISICFSMKRCSQIFLLGRHPWEAIFAEIVFMIATLVLLAYGMVGGPNYLACNNFVRAVFQIATNKQLLFLCSIGFMINGAHARDQTGSCNQVDPAKVWEIIASLTVAAVTILAIIGGVRIARRMMYNRRRAFSDADIINGLMRSPDAARRSDPTFVVHPWIG